jgi:uncharacterized membrane protein
MNFLYTVLSLLFFDFLWINFVAKPKFDVMISSIQGSHMNPNIYRVLLSYIILILFAYTLIPKMNTYYDTFLLGFFTYAVYETTSYALFDKWDLEVVVLDSIWGGILLCLVRYFSLST